MACYRHFIPRGYSTNFYGDNPCPKVHVLTFSHTFWRLRGGVACYRHFIPRGYSTNFYGDNPCPKVHVLTFSHTFWRLRGGVACYRHFKMSSDHTRANGKKDCLIKIKLARYFNWSFFFFSNKIVLTHRNL